MSFSRSGATGILSQSQIYSIQYTLAQVSYMNEREAQYIMNKYGLTLDTTLSAKDSTGQNRVWVNNNPGNGLGDAVVSCRGTQSFDNVKTDIFAVLLGMKEPNLDFKNVKFITLAAENKYGTVDAVGHSLGGTLASYSSANGKIVTFNKGAGLFALFDKTPPNEVDFRCRFDIVSVLSYLEKDQKVTLVNDNLIDIPLFIMSPTGVKVNTVIQAHGLTNFETFLEYALPVYKKPPPIAPPVILLPPIFIK